MKTLPIREPSLRYSGWLTLFTKEMQAHLLTPEIFNGLANYDPCWVYPHYYSFAIDNGTLDHLNRLMYVDLKTWLVDDYMEKIDKATMACSLEARLPLLDHRLVELAFQIPSSFKVKGWNTKHIFKKAVAPLLLPEVLRKRKHGFAVPTDPWFRGELREFTFEVLMDEGTRRRGYFSMPFIERLWREHIGGRHVWDTHLWLLLNFEMWHRIYMDGEGA